MKIIIDIEFFDYEQPTPSKEQLKEWVEFELGLSGEMSAMNPMELIDLYDDEIEVNITVED